jgi:hypothetical protein
LDARGAECAGFVLGVSDIGTLRLSSNPQRRTLTEILFASCSCSALTGSCGPYSCSSSKLLCCGLGAFQHHFLVPGENGVLLGHTIRLSSSLTCFWLATLDEFARRPLTRMAKATNRTSTVVLISTDLRYVVFHRHTKGILMTSKKLFTVSDGCGLHSHDPKTLQLQDMVLQSVRITMIAVSLF